MDKANRYLQAGTRENTRKSYRAAIEHFEVTWGSYLLRQQMGSFAISPNTLTSCH